MRISKLSKILKIGGVIAEIIAFLLRPSSFSDTWYVFKSGGMLSIAECLAIGRHIPPGNAECLLSVLFLRS